MSVPTCPDKPRAFKLCNDVSVLTMKLGVTAQVAAQPGQPAIKMSYLRAIGDTWLTLPTHNACSFAEKHAKSVSESGCQRRPFTQDGHMMARTGPQQREDEDSGKTPQSHCLREIPSDIVLAECHQRQLCLCGTKRLLQLPRQCHYTGIRTRVSSAIVAHEKYLQRLSFCHSS